MVVKPRIRRRHITPLLAILISLTVLIGQHYGWFEQAKQTVQVNQPGLYSVTKFDDGDTIAVNMNGKVETVRFIGVDTPETHDPRKAVQCFGLAAAAFTKNLIGNNQVRLEADPLNTNRDRYNRLLRFIYLPDGTLVNAEIIKQGYGFAVTGFPSSKIDEFRQYEKSARENNLGLWKDCKPYIDSGGVTRSNDAP